MSDIIDPSLDVKTLTTECTTFFTHLKGNEAKEAMRFKYGDYEAIIESVQREKADSQSKGDHIQSKARSKWKGKLDVSVQYNTKPLGRRNSVNKKNSSSVIQDVEEECKMIKHSRNCAKSQSSVGKSGNTNFKRAEVKSSKRNKSYVDDEMLADDSSHTQFVFAGISERRSQVLVPTLL